ncbi:MAG: hypothetical protein SFY56_06825 [Bacteroidota bacterium]|nr:hypothetical protein [Bacteroidota bacterium]
MVKLISSYIIVVVILFQSCSLKKANKEEYEYTGTSYSKNIGKYSFKLTPFDSKKLIALNYKDELERISNAEKDSIQKEYDNYLCFVLEITIDGYTGDIVDFEEQNMESDYNKRLNYFLTEMQNDLILKDSKGIDTPCNIYYFQRLSELAKTNKFIVGFSKPSSNEITFQYKNSLLKCGTINFSFNKNNI